MINTTQVVGEANITALSADTPWNYSVDPYLNPLACVYCASLQMNLNVVVETNGGATQNFWVQNVLSFYNTQEQEMSSLSGLVFNMTVPHANITSTAYGSGRLGTLGGQTTYAFGSLGGVVYSYSLPLAITLRTSVSLSPDHRGIKLSLSDLPLESANFGSVFLPIRNATSVRIVVSPYALIPYGFKLEGSYDAELVWAAFCCGQVANFQEMNSTLSLSYLNASGKLVPFPSFYTFGSDTGESAANLVVLPTQNGGRVVQISGTDNNTMLHR